MTIAFSIPFWAILLILIGIGVIGFFVIVRKTGDFDIFTPMLALLFIVFFAVLAIGLAIGKLVF